MTEVPNIKNCDIKTLKSFMNNTGHVKTHDKRNIKL